MDIPSFIAGIAIGIASTLPVVIERHLGWRNEAREHRRARNERDLADDALRMARSRADSITRGVLALNQRIFALIRERDAATAHLTVALDQINALEPLADIGRRRRAALLKSDQVRRHATKAPAK